MKFSVKFFCVLNQPVDQPIRNPASADTMSAPGVICSVVYQFNESQLRRAKQSLIFRRVNDVALHIVETNLSPDIVLELVQVFKWVVCHSSLPFWLFAENLYGFCES